MSTMPSQAKYAYQLLYFAESAQMTGFAYRSQKFQMGMERVVNAVEPSGAVATSEIGIDRL
jgi:hypothetical protein